MAELRVALLGLEHPHCDHWQAAFRAEPACALVGVWAATPGLAARKAAAYGVPAFDDREALVAAVDAVAICSPTAEHLALIALAARSRKPVLCEKPVAGTFEDCRAIEEAVRAAGGWYMQGFPKRFDPVNHEIRSLLADGCLGRVLLARVRHGHPFAALEEGFRDGWFADPARAGGGALLDEGVHAADLLRWLFGEPERVACLRNHVPARLPVEETALAMFEYADGLLAEIASSWHFLAADNSVEIYGSDGALVLSGVDLGSRDLTDTVYLRHYSRAGRAGVPLSAASLGERAWVASASVPQFKRDTGAFHGNVARAFVEAVAAGSAPPVSLDDGLRAARMILSAYRAAESGRTEPVLLD